MGREGERRGGEGRGGEGEVRGDRGVRERREGRGGEGRGGERREGREGSDACGVSVSKVWSVRRGRGIQYVTLYFKLAVV